MKKIFLFLLCVAISLLMLVACGNVDEEELPVSEVVDQETCEHTFSMAAFVTEKTDISYAALYRCEKCKKEEQRSFSYTDIDIPLVSITGDLSVFVEKSGASDKERKETVAFLYQSKGQTVDCAATVKLQGKSSSTDPKKNYSINLSDAESGEKRNVAFDSAWGEGYKYVLKANYSEPSSVRNVALSALYGQMAHGLNLADHYADLVNCGAVDGYPVLLYVNGQYQGLYDWVIRKDKWLYGMGDETAGEAVLEGSEVDVFDSEEGVVMLPEGMASAKSWSEEYVNENYGEKGWAEASFNEMLFAIRNADSAQLRAVILEYIEIERTLDVMLFNAVFGATDSISGNQVWCTFNGKKWAPVPYDYDRSLGRSGNCLTEADENPAEVIERNRLYDIIMNAYSDEIRTRYAALRQNVFTVENVMSVIKGKLVGLDERFFVAELEKWPEASWRECEGSELITGFDAELAFIESYVTERFVYCDSFFGRVGS